MKKGLKISTIVFEVLSTIIFLLSLIWVGYFIYYIEDYFSNVNWSGLGSAASFIFYIFHFAVNAIFIIVSIILSSVTLKKGGKKIGYICLFTNIGYVTIHIICFIMMVVVLTSK